jgi:hypothetical protein
MTTTRLSKILDTELRNHGRNLPSYAQAFGLSADTLVSMVAGERSIPSFVVFDLEETLGVPVSRLRSLTH